MAGAGYKLFNTGDVLTAAQVNTYLQEQAVMRFANAAARTTALSGVLAEGMVSYLMDTNAVEVYDGSAWVGVATGDITAVTAGTGISGGGTSGAVTITNSMATEITAAGDIIVGTGSGTFDNLPIGTTGQVLTADTTVSPYKVKWAAAAGGGDYIKITSASFTNQSSVTVDSCFTSTYSDYIVYVSASYATGGSSASDLQIQFRYGSTTQTTDYYGSYFEYNRSNTLATGGFSNTAQTTLSLDMGDSTSPTQAQLNFFRVGNASENAGYYATGISQQVQAAFVATGWQNVARTYTGFLIKASAGNITGSYSVYGVTK